MAWKASKGCGTDPAAHEGHFEKAASRANNSNNAEREAGGRERQRTCSLKRSLEARASRHHLTRLMWSVMCPRPDRRQSSAKLTGLDPTEKKH